MRSTNSQLPSCFRVESLSLIMQQHFATFIDSSGGLPSKKLGGVRVKGGELST